MKEPIDRNVLMNGLVARFIEEGLSERNSETVARHLTDAEILNIPSHGLQRLEAVLDLLRTGDRNGPGTFDQIALSVHHYSAGGELGIVALHKAAVKLREITTEQYVGVMAVTGYVGTTGVLGSYSRMLADAGLVGIALCGSEYSVAPHGGTRAILGTNPVAVAFPAESMTFSADVATAAWAYGKIKEEMRADRQVPVGVVQSLTGQESTDPHDADRGSQLPMAGHKGYALGLAVELLCGPLIGAKAGRHAVPGGDGALLLGLRGDSFRPSESVTTEADLLFDEIRQTPLRPGATTIRISGDRYRQLMADHKVLMVDSAILRRCGITLGSA